MNKVLLILLIMGCNARVLSQNTAVIAQPEYNVLYAGCSNTVQIGRQDAEKNTVLLAEGMDIQLVNVVTGTYTFTPRGKDIISLYILNETQQDTLDIIKFRVLPIPDAEIYLGNHKSGETLKTRTNNQIALKLPSYVPVQANMTIEDWTLTLSSDKKEFVGTGNTLSNEALLAIQAAPKNTIIQLHVAYKTNGKGIKRQTVNFTL